MPRVTVTSKGTTDSAGSHKHDIKSPAGKADDGNGLGRGYIWDKVKIYSTEESGSHKHGVTVSGSFGGGQSHNNLPPYQTIYRWVRTA